MITNRPTSPQQSEIWAKEINMNIFRLALHIPIATLVTLALSVPVFYAPKACGAGAEIEEIVVTARKREESLQEIPLSVTAFSAQEIERAAFNDLEDISLNTPGLQFNTELSGFRSGRLFSNMRFRGVEGSQFATLQTASLFVDGIFALQAAQSLALTDLERVEVIKGPQSAIFGRNSFAGAINYVTRKPSLTEFSGKVSADVGNYDQYEVSASIEGPIVKEKLAFRLGVRSYNKGNMYTASDGGGLGEQSSKSIFATVIVQPIENLSFKFRAYYQEDDDGPEAVALMGRFSGPDKFNDSCTGTSYTGYDPDGNVATLYPKEYLCGKVPDPGEPGAPPIDTNTSLRPNFGAFIGDPDGDGLDNSNFLIDKLLNAGRISGVPSMNSFGLKREITRLSLVGEYVFKSGITVTATLAYNENNAANIRDFDATPVISWYVTNPQAGEDKSIDVRIASAGDKRLRWMGGYNYYEQDFLTSANAGVLVHACGNFGAFAGLGDFCDFPGVFPVGLDGGDFVEQSSIYGNISFDITKKLTIDLEGRYQEDQRSDGVTPYDKTYYSFIPRVTLTFKPTENITAYVLGTQGVLPGVINANYIQCDPTPYISPFPDPDTGEPSTLSVCEQYRKQLGPGAKEFTDQQTLDAYEFGLKTSWANGRVIANISIYKQKWKDQPSTQGVTAYLDNANDPATGQVAGDGIPNLNPNFFSVAVAGSSKYSGVELESAFVPTDNWTVNFNMSYNKNEFTDFFTAGEDDVGAVCGTNNFKGKRNARFPKWSGSLSSTYTHQLTGPWSAFARGDVSYTGEAPADQCNRATLRDYYLVNARIGVEKENLRLELYVKNLFDEDTWRSGNNFADFSVRGNGFSPLSWPGIILIPQDKRTVGIRVALDF